MLAARGPILDWWQAAYGQGSVLPRRFADEARASLPGLAGMADQQAGGEAVFRALDLQRLRLRHDQQVPEWLGSAGQ